MSHIIITGVPPARPNLDGAIPSRLEIHDFIKKEDHFSLYIQALQAVYATPESDPLSYYQISGIHGMPFTSWNGAPGGKSGYCNHRSVLFPTWHRPYMALLEQAIQKKAVAIANTYTVDKARFQKAAIELRQPYWDWARKAVPPDEVISKTKVAIIKPNGSRGLVDNPLLKYKFPSQRSRSIFPFPFSQWDTTMRVPNNSSVDATPDLDRLKEILEDGQQELTRDTLSLLTLVHTWPLFSNRRSTSGGFTNSLEAIHDSIHVYIGGMDNPDRDARGHMNSPAVAAFDPIFYLHHTNVDRLISLWAAINPGVGVSAQNVNGVNLTASSALLPFWNSSNGMWDSKPLVSSGKVLDYTYPEFVGFENATAEKLADHILQQVQRLYGDPMQNLAASLPSPSPVAPVLAPVAKSAEAAPAPKPAATARASTAHEQAAVKLVQEASPHAQQQVLQGSENSTHTDSTDVSSKKPIAISGTKWTARIRCNHHDLQGSFSVLLFIGDVPEDPKAWRRAPSYVGADNIFLMEEEAKKQCANCQGSDAPADTQPVSYVEGYVHLNDALKKAELPSLEADVVAPFLRTNLHWRVKWSNGEVVWLNSLEVVVIETSLELPRGSLHPIVKERKKLNDVTHGRSGGARKPSA